MPTRAKDILLVPIILFLTFYFFFPFRRPSFSYSLLDDTKREREWRKKKEIMLYIAVYMNFRRTSGVFGLKFVAN